MKSDTPKRVNKALADEPTRDARPAAFELMQVVYDELRRLAQTYLHRERGDHTLDPTALVHEAFLRLAHQDRLSWQGRTHFFAVGAQMMRRLLVDHARQHQRVKRGGEWQRVSLDATALAGRALDQEEILTLDLALAELARRDPRQAQIVELRFFAGLTVGEVAELLEVSKRTVEGEWTHARAWLRRALAGKAEHD